MSDNEIVPAVTSGGEDEYYEPAAEPQDRATAGSTDPNQGAPDVSAADPQGAPAEGSATGSTNPRDQGATADPRQPDRDPLDLTATAVPPRSRGDDDQDYVDSDSDLDTGDDLCARDVPFVPGSAIMAGEPDTEIDTTDGFLVYQELVRLVRCYKDSFVRVNANINKPTRELTMERLLNAFDDDSLTQILSDIIIETLGKHQLLIFSCNFNLHILYES